MRMQSVLLRAACGCVLVGILTAGLWPFHAPRNQVTWLTSGGVGLGKHGSMISAQPLPAGNSQGDPSCTLEIWLQPTRLNAEGTVLAFYWPSSKVRAFTLRQWRNGLVLEREAQGRTEGAGGESAMYAPDVFRGGRPAFFAISSSAGGTDVYVDGRVIKSVPDFVLRSRNLSGELVVGNSPTTTYNWSGEVKGLAIYHRARAAAEIAHDLADWKNRDWKNNAQAEVDKSAAHPDGLIARYLFDEGRGGVVRNQADAATSLLIPERFFILHEQFLERPWDEYRPNWHYWKDIVVNIAGFIPLGFFFGVYFSTILNPKQAATITIALGFAVSLTIEVLQAFLPTRDSGMTDLVTNTFGTALGMILCAWVSKRGWWEKAGATIDAKLRVRWNLSVPAAENHEKSIAARL